MSCARYAGLLIAWSLAFNLLITLALIHLAPSPSPHSRFALAVGVGSEGDSEAPHAAGEPQREELSPHPSWKDSGGGLHQQQQMQASSSEAADPTLTHPDVGLHATPNAEVEDDASDVGEEIDAADDPLMRTSLRLCPAAPSCVVLPWTSRWLHPAAPRVARYAGSVDEGGALNLSVDLPSALIHGPHLRLGVGYGLTEHESQPWQSTDWPTYARQQADARQQRDASPSSSSASFDLDPPDVQQRLEWLASYDYHQAEQREAALPPRYEPTPAPWFEVDLRDEAGGADQRLLILEAEWLQLGQPFRRGLWAEGEGEDDDAAEAQSLVDGVSLLVVLLPVVPFYDSVNVSVFDIPFSNDAFAERLFARVGCSFGVEVEDRASSPHFAAATAAAAAVRGAELRPVTLQHNPLWKGVSHHMVHCPLPPLALPLRRLLSEERPSGPPLSLTSLTLHFPDAADWTSFGLRSLTLPLCLLRSRAVTTALVLSSQLGPPHMLRPSQLHDFLAYYLFLGVQRIHVPDRYGSLLPSLLPYLAQGAVAYTRQPFLTPHHQPYLDQVPALAAALMRERLTAEWVISVDVDELLSFDHPYWAEGAGVHPPDDLCWPHPLRPPPTAVERCSSMLSDFFAQPGMGELSLLVLPSVPHWAMKPSLNATLTSLYHPPSSSDRDTQLHPPLTAALTTLAPFHPVEVWSRRSHAAEFHRFKCLFRPAHVQSITMHDVVANERSVREGRTGMKVEAWHKYWGDAGLQRHKEHIMNHTLLTDPHPLLALAPLFCDTHPPPPADIQRSFNLSCCTAAAKGSARSASSASVLNCFARTEGFDPYLLSTLTPLFPTVGQSNPKVPPHLLLPVKLPPRTYPLPLALFGLHISHVFCMFLHPRVWPQCTTAQLTWNKGPMWGEGKRDGSAFEAEEQEERGKALLTRMLREWWGSRMWAEHRDMRGYEERRQQWEAWRMKEAEQG